jgi:hypothetical protein
MGVLANEIYDLENQKQANRLRLFKLDYSIPFSFILVFLGILSLIPLLISYINLGFRLPQTLSTDSYHAVGGLGLIIFGINYFTSALLFNATILNNSHKA